MKRHQWSKLLLVLSLAALLITACGAGESPPPEVVDALTSESEQAMEPAGEDVDSPDHEDQGEMEAEDQAAQDDDSDDADAPAAPPPEPKAGLEATDPSTVVLASGSPQLIEFFAFW